MAVSSRTMTRQRDFSKLIIALAVLAGVVAIAPIIAAAAGLVGATRGPRTAFASAPAGEYAVIGRSDGNVDVISVARADNPGTVTEVARLTRLDGFPSSGAVAPDGRKLALVSVDGGTASRPLASLNIIALDTGKVTRAVTEVSPGQSPLWAADSAGVFVVRAGGEHAGAPIQLLRAGADGSSAKLVKEYASVLGVYPAGFDANGNLATVVIGSQGSVLEHGGASTLLSPNLTRDWRMNADGTEIAFIEVDTSVGTRYLARSLRLDSTGDAQALTAELPALGTAFNPATGRVTFGVEPAVRRSGAEALSAPGAAASGFDIPQGYSASGKALVVTHWTGDSFQAPGRPELTMVKDGERTGFDSYSRFYGWAAR